MYNKITLIGIMTDNPQGMVDPDGNWLLLLSLKVPLPSEAPPTYWGLVYDLRGPDWTTGDDTFLVVCRDRSLTEKYATSLHEGDVICIEGRLVLTGFHNGQEMLQLAEILASDLIPLTNHSNPEQGEAS